MPTFKITLGTFGDDDSADIMMDGHVIGWLERVKGERFASASSRTRASFITHYSITLMADLADALLTKHDVPSRAEAKLEVARTLEKAWIQQAKELS